MIERTPYDDLIELTALVVGGFFIILLFVFLTAPIPEPTQIPEIVNTPPEPTPTPAPEPTPEPTPEAVEIPQTYIDPYAPGIRSEGQWYKWFRSGVVQNHKEMDVGIIAYNHAFLNRYTWYNAAQGNYFTQNPGYGNRFFAVWIHEEMFGTNISQDSRMWGYDETAFRLQVGDQLISSTTNTTHNPVNRIKEFDYYYDYYDTVTAPPFSYRIVYTGKDPKTGGFIAERLGWIRMGRDNGFDGYILFEVPRETKDADILLLGSFGTFGDAAWRLS